MKVRIVTAAIAAAAIIGPVAALADEQGADAQNVDQATKSFV